MTIQVFTNRICDYMKKGRETKAMKAVPIKVIIGVYRPTRQKIHI